MAIKRLLIAVIFLPILIYGIWVGYRVLSTNLLVSGNEILQSDSITPAMAEQLAQSIILWMLSFLGFLSLLIVWVYVLIRSVRQLTQQTPNGSDVPLHDNKP